jgi:SAM-dependent methyltransferase
MTADGAIYGSERLAAAYAFSRPPVHRHVAARVVAHLSAGIPVDAALDIGCGAGMSTAALVPLARRVVGLEPSAPMLKHASTVAVGAEFLVGRAEALPFEPSAFDLITAAGALNYADVALSLPEVARVMSLRGLFVPYDFSAGRRIRDDHRLTDWYAQFRARFPSPSGYSLNLRALDYRTHDLELVDYEEVEVGIPMSSAAYVDYLLGDAGIEEAIAGGQPESHIRRFCEDGVGAVFAARPREVLFEAQIGYVRRRSHLSAGAKPHLSIEDA